MSESPEDLAAVEQLLAESDALHGWLTRLDQATVAAPDAVRDRVRRDYQNRLDQITAGLRAHADVIGGKLDADRREHGELLARATAAREALAEAELRHAVGEFTGDRFESEQTRYRSDIETYDLSLAAMAERIARLESVHSLVNRMPRAPAAEVGNVSEVAELPGEEATADETEQPVAIADLAPDADSSDPLAIFDEAGPIERKAALPENGPLSFRPSGSGGEPVSRARPFETAPPLGIPAGNSPPRFIRPGERIRVVPPAPPATIAPAIEKPASPPPPARELFAEEIVAAGPAPEAAVATVGRTLRCSECGAMNRPLEWYCEKCGAELTAV